MLRRALRSARPAIAKIPAAHLRFGYEIAQLSDVRWSADGTVVHYRLWLENEHRDPRAVLMGHFVEVATGRVLGRYRLDRAGTLPEPERSQWKRAMSFEAGASPWDRLDYARVRALATIHPLVPTKHTTLQLLPPATSAAPSRSRSRLAHPVAPTRVAKPRTGCGCSSAPWLPGFPVALIVTLQLLLLARRRLT